jgi:hypothetical protein
MTTTAIMKMTATDALLRWVGEANAYGDHANGVVFCQTERDRNRYLIAADVALPVYTRSRTFHGPIRYHLDSGASISMFVVPDLEAASLIEETWPYIILDDPVRWPNSAVPRFLASLLRPGAAGGGTLTSVKSLPVWFPDTAAESSSSSDIDYLAITRSLST